MRPSTGHILEIAWAHTQKEGTLGPVHSYLIQQPDDAFISRRVTELTGILPSDMQAAISQQEALEKLFSESREACLIHYAQFEKPFLQTLAQAPELEILCTHQMARRLVPDLPTKGVRGLAGYFGVPLEGEVKRASAHVHATWVIWQGLVAELEKLGITDLGALREWL